MESSDEVREQVTQRSPGRWTS